MSQIFRGNIQSVRKQIADELDKKADLAGATFTDTVEVNATLVVDPASGSSEGGEIALRDTDSLDGFRIDVTGASSATNEKLRIRNVGATSDMVMDRAGKVGFGTSSPAAKIEISGGTATVAPLKLNTGTNLTTPQTGAVEFDGNALYFTSVNVRRAATLANGTIIADTTVGNTTTETTAFTEEVAANELHAYQRVKVYVDGIYSTANASDTFTIRIKVGGTTVATLVSTAASVTDAPFSLDFAMTVRSSGASGSAVSKTTGFFDDELKQAATTGALALDTTVAEDITVTVQWSAANAGNTLTVQQGHAEFIN